MMPISAANGIPVWSEEHLCSFCDISTPVKRNIHPHWTMILRLAFTSLFHLVIEMER